MALTAKVMPYKHRFGPFAPEVYRVPMSYPLRDGGRSGAEAAARAIDVMDKQVGGANVAAVLIEPIQGEGGFVVPAPGFLPAIKAWAEAAGAVFIADEIQTGFCRTGSWFASEHEDVVPDLVTTAKGMAGGLPLGGVVGRADLMDAVHVGGLGGTYGGNPLACAASLAAIETMRELDLAAAARRIEGQFVPRLRELAAADPGIGDVRGRGAMVAIELVKPGTIEPDPARTGAVAKACHAAGLLVLTCGTYGNVLRFLPPLVISEGEVSRGLAILGRSLLANVPG
jgi:4-aminobutyrate aminotransferase/(S)-3-amino-2-methylpropionate transaminase